MDAGLKTLELAQDAPRRSMPRLVRPSAFVAEETNPANGPTPTEAMQEALRRLEAVAYAKGFEAALTRLEMLAAVVPDSVTKAQLVDMLKREVQACIGEWNATQRPNVEVCDGGRKASELEQDATVIRQHTEIQRACKTARRSQRNRKKTD